MTSSDAREAVMAELHNYVIWDPTDGTYWTGDGWGESIKYAEQFPAASAAMDVIEDDIDPDDILLDQLTVCRAWEPKIGGDLAMKCDACDGCGRVANDEDRSPWTHWANLPPGSDVAIRLGLVRPETCEACGGTGETSEADKRIEGETE